MNLSLAENKGTVEVTDASFGREYNEGLVHQVLVAFMAGSRQGSRAQKNRSRVSGGASLGGRKVLVGRELAPRARRYGALEALPSLRNLRNIRLK